MLRVIYVFIFAFLIVVLGSCAVISFRSKKPIGRYVGFLCLALIPPVLGNMIIVSSTTERLSLVGCYTYYIGMDLIMFTLIRFTHRYCEAGDHKQISTFHIPQWVNLFLAADVIQLALNPIFGHAFVLQEIEVDNAPYFLMTPLPGQTYHRLVCYAILLMVIITFIIMCIKTPRIYMERYAVILGSMIVGTLWQTFYIFSRTPIDRSMIGFGVFGILIFYFSIYYRPVRLLDRLLANIVSDRDEAAFLLGPEDKCVWANKPAREFAGIRENDYSIADDVLKAYFGDITSLPEKASNEYTIGSENDIRYYSLDHSTMYDDAGRKLGSYVIITDNTEERLRVEKELYSAKHDALTGLYNKEYLFREIEKRLRKRELNGYYVAFIDIRNFKIVNDVFGRDFGDYALKEVANWIKGYSDSSCIYGRLGGDTFGSCLPKELVNQELIEKDLTNFIIKRNDTIYHLEMNIGFCDITDQDEDVSILFDRARLALAPIRDEYKIHVALYDSRMKEKVRYDQEIISHLSTAIKEDQILPYLQPIADRNGRIVGAEALARWIHPVQGFMSPADFIPLFEKNGMIVDVDKHIWRFVCRILSEWKEKYPDLFISVNISPKDFYLTDVLADIEQMVKDYEIDPSKLRIEVTESSMMNDTEGRMKILQEFRDRGFIVEMDDFGSGFSSLNMLKDMPVDVVKIDMRFLGRSTDDQKANIIVKNVIKLTEDLGIQSLTEGVETIDQFNMLSDMGCHLFQGYYFSKPVPRAEFEKTIL